MAVDWNVHSWKERVSLHPFPYEDEEGLSRVVERLRTFPPLVTSWEIERLKGLLADAEVGRRFVLQGGDCAETLADCQPGPITRKLKILLQMSLVMVHAGRRPVIRVGRFAGQYAKPRTSFTEAREGISLPSYFGDLINRAEFSAEARVADPRHMLSGYHHAALTLNFVRSLSAGGFADVAHPEYWDLPSSQEIPGDLRGEYDSIVHHLREAFAFVETLGEKSVEELTRVEFFTSHEGLNLHYESAQTRRVPRRDGTYCLTTHFPWIGDRTRALEGAHVEFFRGIENPVGVKVGPTADPQEIAEVALRLNPKKIPGKVALVTRLGATRVEDLLPKLVAAVRQAGARVLWMCDPMHGNTRSLGSGKKTRRVEDILRELHATLDVHAGMGTLLGGVHVELTGEDVTECVGGGSGIEEADLEKHYESACDPRLNYRQSLDLSVRLSKRLRALPRPPEAMRGAKGW